MKVFSSPIRTNNNFDEELRERVLTATKSSVNGRFQTFSIEAIQSEDIESGIQHSLPIIERILAELLLTFHALKFYIVYEVKMVKIIEESPTLVAFYSKSKTLFTDDDILDILYDCKAKIINSVDAFHRKGKIY